jgi:arylsulfotransferase ASST
MVAINHRRARVAVVAVALAAATAAGAAPSVYPTGVTRYDPARAYNGYVLFGGADRKTHLIDMSGAEVHAWPQTGSPSEMLDPALTGAPGHVLLQLSHSANSGTGYVPGAPVRINKTIGEVDWSGKVVWSWGEQAPGGAAQQHHDWNRTAAGDTLILANSVHPIKGFAAPQVYDDVIYQIGRDGRITWRWAASEHLEEFGFTPAQLALVKASESPDYLHLNNMSPLGPNRWFDAGDKRFAPDNILIDSRNANFIAIIEKATGRIVWRIGPNFPPPPPMPMPGAALQTAAAGPRPVDQISGQHDAHLIPKGLPGAGNLLVFDNQGEGGYPVAPRGVTSGSRVLEIDPVKKAIVWEYAADMSGAPQWSFHSAFISSARRLPNGNTLIDEGMNGRLFQVTPAGDIVWEYVSPYFGDVPVGSRTRTVQTNFVYRAQPVPYDWVPAGTPRSEAALTPPANADFRVSTRSASSQAEH